MNNATLTERLPYEVQIQNWDGLWSHASSHKTRAAAEKMERRWQAIGRRTKQGSYKATRILCRY